MVRRWWTGGDLNETTVCLRCGRQIKPGSELHVMQQDADKHNPSTRFCSDPCLLGWQARTTMDPQAEQQLPAAPATQPQPPATPARRKGKLSPGDDDF